MNKPILSIMILLAFFGVAKGQSDFDAIRFSRVNPGGTARYIGMGGAFGALGADLSVSSVNPAGFGVYRSNEFSVTPVVTLGNAKSTYLGETNTDGKSVFNFGNIGLVFTNEIPNRLNQPGLRFINFGVSLNRLADYNNRYMTTGNNYGRSRVDIWLNEAAGLTEGELLDMNGPYIYGPGLAFKGFLINPSKTPNEYTTFVPNPLDFSGPNAFLRQEQILETTGSMNQWDFTLSGNYNDVLYFGLTLGIPYFNYSEKNSFSEINVNNLAPTPQGTESLFNSYTYTLNIDVSATGVNLKGGVIVKPVDQLRLGFAAHTPTWYTNVKWSRNTTMFTDLVVPGESNFSKGTVESPINDFEFNLRTPYRLIASAAYLFGNVGLVSVDYEYVDYKTAKFKASDYNYINENNAIKDNYGSGNNIRIGTEWRAANFSFRGGFNYQASPFKNKDFKNAESYTYSAGVGYRNNNMFVDLGWAWTRTNDDFMLYNYMNGNQIVQTELAKNVIDFNKILLTIGYRF